MPASPNRVQQQKPQGFLAQPPKVQQKTTVKTQQKRQNARGGRLGGNPYSRAETQQNNAATTSYNDMNQDVIGGAQGELGGAINDMKSGIDWDSLPQVNSDPNAFQQSVDSVYKAFTDRNDPVFKQEEIDFDQQMANRGIPIGSDLYNQQKGQLEQRHNDARTQAMSQAQQMGMDYYKTQNDVQLQQRNQFLNEAMTKRNLNWDDFVKIRSQIDMTDPRTQKLFQSNSALAAMDNKYKQQQTQQQYNLSKSLQGGGGGGGRGYSSGGGAPAADPNAVGADGLTQAQRDKMWEWQNNPYYQKLAAEANAGNKDSADLLSQIGGQILKGVTGKVGDVIGDAISGIF